MKKFDTAIIIPAYNEQDSIGSVVIAVQQYGLIIVVDDGSNDLTAEIAKTHGAHVICHFKNQGYESALDTGFKVASKMSMKYIVTLDADGQHDPQKIKQFIDELDLGADVVVGARDKLQRIGEYVFAFIGSRVWGISDPLCGMKAYRLNSLSIESVQPKFDSVGTRFAINAAKSGKKIRNIDISTRRRMGCSRFGDGWRANKKIFAALLYSLK